MSNLPFGLTTNSVFPLSCFVTDTLLEASPEFEITVLFTIILSFGFLPPSRITPPFNNVFPMSETLMRVSSPSSATVSYSILPFPLSIIILLLPSCSPAPATVKSILPLGFEDAKTLSASFVIGISTLILFSFAAPEPPVILEVISILPPFGIVAEPSSFMEGITVLSTFLYTISLLSILLPPDNFTVPSSNVGTFSPAGQLIFTLSSSVTKVFFVPFGEVIDTVV